MAIIVMFFRDYYVKLKLQRLALRKYAAMKAFIEKLAVNTPVTEAELSAIAKNPSLRLALFHALKAYNREASFPKIFYTEEKGAESRGWAAAAPPEGLSGDGQAAARRRDR